MGDRTSYTLNMELADLTDKRVERIVEVAFDGYADSVGKDYGQIMEAEHYVGDTERRAEALVEYLVKKGIDREFRLWEDPKYEWLGTVAIHQPGRPLFTADCDAEGQVVLNASVIRRALETIPDAELSAWLRRNLGED